MDADDWNAVIDQPVRAVLDDPRRRAADDRHGTGRIINMASVAGRIGNVGRANYVAAKAGPSV